MPAPFVVAIGDVVISLLSRLGLGQLVNFASVRAVLGGLSFRLTTLRTWFEAQITAKNGMYILLTGWLAEKLDVAFDVVEGWYNEYGGDVKGWFYGFANETFIEFLRNFIAAQYPDLDAELTVKSDYKLLPFTDNSIRELLSLMGLLAVAELKKAKPELADSAITNVYPPQQFIDDLKIEVISEFQRGYGALFGEQDIESIKMAIKSQIENELLTQFGMYSTAGIRKKDNAPITAKKARQRAQARERQRVYRETHTRNHQWYPI